MSYFARNTVLRLMISLAEKHGVTAQQILSHVELSEEDALRPGGMIPASKGIDAIELAAEASACHDFGLQIGSGVDDTIFAAAGLFLGHCTSLSQVVDEVTRYIHMMNSALVFVIDDVGGCKALHVRVLCGSKHTPRHYIECVVYLMTRFCRHLLGSAWKPEMIMFRHSACASRQRYREAFGCEVRSNSEYDGFGIFQADLERQITITGTPIGEVVDVMLDETHANAEAPIENLPAKVASIISSTSGERRATAESVARQLSLSTRSLQRQLSRQGTSFSRIVEELRSNAAAKSPGGGKQGGS